MVSNKKAKVSHTAAEKDASKQAHKLEGRLSSLSGEIFPVNP